MNAYVFWSLIVTCSLALIIMHMLWEDKKFMTQGKVKVIYILSVIACGTGLIFIILLLMNIFKR